MAKRPSKQRSSPVSWEYVIRELRMRLDDLVNDDKKHTREIEGLRDCITKLLEAQKGQLTPEQVVALNVILLLKDRKTWVWGRVKVYAITVTGVVASIYIFREWLSEILAFLARIIVIKTGVAP